MESKCTINEPQAQPDTTALISCINDLRYEGIANVKHLNGIMMLCDAVMTIAGEINEKAGRIGIVANEERIQKVVEDADEITGMTHQIKAISEAISDKANEYASIYEIFEIYDRDC